MLRILHLSDLHFGGTHHFRNIAAGKDRRRLADAVEEAIGDLKIDGVILSGDFFSHRQDREFHEALQGMTDLTGMFDRKRIERDRILCVPGNHDLSWNEDHKSNRFIHYEGLMRSFHLEAFLQPQFPVPCLWPLPGEEGLVAFLLFDSNIVESEVLSGQGFIGPSQLAKARQKLKTKLEQWSTETGSETPPDLRMIFAVVHHHLLPITPYQSWEPTAEADGKVRSSVTLDASDVLKQLSEMKISAVFHGHQHEPAALRIANLLARTPELRIFAAGSVGAKSPEATSRQFFVYEIEEGKIRARSFENKSGYSFTEPGTPIVQPLFVYTDPRRDVCELDSGVSLELPRPVSVAKPITRDQSDLWYLFLTASNTREARTKIMHTVLTMDTEPVWNTLRPKKLEIHGMYDVMGRWDIVARIRYQPGDDASDKSFTPIYDVIRHKLVQAGQLSSPKDTEGELYTMSSPKDIKREMRLNSYGHSDEAFWLSPHQTDYYDCNRCQRAFVCIDVQQGQLLEMQKELNRMLTVLESDAKGRQTRRIIQSISYAEDIIVMEVFMTCSQMVQINHLNRALEDWVPNFRTRNFTLVCFDYQEDVMGAAPRSRAGGLRS